MSFVPRHLEEGAHVRLLQPASNSAGTFNAGHVFAIMEVHINPDGDVYDLRDRDLNLLFGVAASEVEPFEPYD